MRLFAAMELPDYVSAGLQAWWLDASAILPSADWRPVPAHLWHLTLAFYGDVAAHGTDDLSGQLSECAALSPSYHLQTGVRYVSPAHATTRILGWC